MTKKAAGIYARISEDREGRELGVDRQQEDCRALAEIRGLSIADLYVDNDRGASTRSRKPRPEYRRLLADARAGRFAVVVAYTSGRLTRRPREHEDLIELAEQHGVRFEYVRSPSFDLNTAAGRRVARILAANDAGEAEDIAERVTRAAEQRARDGLNHGGRRAFGYEVNGLEVIPHEAREVKSMYEQLLVGVPLGSIVRDLNQRQVPTYSGALWAPSTVRGIMLRARYAGLREYRGDVVGRGRWPAVVDEEVWRAACALLTDPSRRTSTGNRASYLLSGLAVCGTCGGRITSAGVKRSSAIGYRRQYKCRSGSHVNRRQDWIDDFVSAVIVERLSRPDAVELLVDEKRPDSDVLRVEAQALRVRIDDLATALADGLLDLAGVRRESERLRAKLADVEAQMAHSSRSPLLAALISAADVQAVWDALTLDRRRAVVDVLMTVTLHPGGTGRRTFDQTKVEITWKTS